ncbi:MAG TPA: hypothetical protein VGR55_10460, partial [Candidatus Acidoferrum sp.]|nr:hypothetical protein [Candidatus Acidoferrum sp.]
VGRDKDVGEEIGSGFLAITEIVRLIKFAVWRYTSILPLSFILQGKAQTWAQLGGKTPPVHHGITEFWRGRPTDSPASRNPIEAISILPVTLWPNARRGAWVTAGRFGGRLKT